MIASESNRPDLAKLAGICNFLRDSGQIRPDSDETDRNLVHWNPAAAAGRHRISLYVVSDFLV